MVSNSEFNLARADECERDADKTMLPNVREQLTRSAKTWRTMGDAALAYETLQAQAKTKAADVDDACDEGQTGMKVMT